jgi:hypothetical protein
MWSAFLPGRLDAMPIKLDRKPSSRKVQYGGSPLAEAANGSSQLTYLCLTKTSKVNYLCLMITYIL